MILKRMSLYILLSLLSIGSISCRTKRLEFRDNGTFKIVQFTDTHIHQQAVHATALDSMMQEVLDVENPDLVILTGDIVTRDCPEKIWQELAEIFAARQVSWCAVLGNHDDEYDTSRKELAVLFQRLPYCVNETVEHITGTTNFILPIVGKDDRVEALIYGLDSNAYSTLVESVEGYGWFDISQILWYKKQSKKFTQENGGFPLPALAFFHIPFPEYKDVWISENTRRFGVKEEKVCSPEINTGMFAAMVECGDVMGTFVGHDHVNDYIGCLQNIALAYGRASGGKNSYGDAVPGARVIVLKEGKRTFETWIREKGDGIKYRCDYPFSFTTDQKEVERGR